MTKIHIHHFSDSLCIWAYVAQVRIDELRRQFGERVEIEYYFINLFGSKEEKIGHGWEARGGFAGYADHVATIAGTFPHIEIHADVWRRCRPVSSGNCHLFLKGVQLLEKRDMLPSSVEEISRRIRLAFFRDGRDVGDLDVLRDLAVELELPLDALLRLLTNGEAMAALSADTKQQEQYRVEGSPTYVLNEGRQKLYGNVGYRILEANVLELFDTPEGRASWC